MHEFTREDYEHAARAAGIVIDRDPNNGAPEHCDGFDALGNVVLDWHNGTTWNPATDDGDALRLAIKARISLIHEEEYVGGPVLETLEATGPLREDGSRYCVTAALNYYCTDPMAEVRHAIFRAAIEIGKSMAQKGRHEHR